MIGDIGVIVAVYVFVRLLEIYADNKDQKGGTYTLVTIFAVIGMIVTGICTFGLFTNSAKLASGIGN